MFGEFHRLGVTSTLARAKIYSRGFGREYVGTPPSQGFLLSFEKHPDSRPRHPSHSIYIILGNIFRARESVLLQTAPRGAVTSQPHMATAAVTSHTQEAIAPGLIASHKLA